METTNEAVFASGGFEEFPPLYFDNRDIATISEWPTEVLEERVHQYGQFLSKPQMPRATATANRILDHMIFELAFRDGVYDEYTGKSEDELCEEAL